MRRTSENAVSRTCRGLAGPMSPRVRRPSRTDSRDVSARLSQIGVDAGLLLLPKHWRTRSNTHGTPERQRPSRIGGRRDAYIFSVRVRRAAPSSFRTQIIQVRWWRRADGSRLMGRVAPARSVAVLHRRSREIQASATLGGGVASTQTIQWRVRGSRRAWWRLSEVERLGLWRATAIHSTAARGGACTAGARPARRRRGDLHFRHLLVD